MIVLEELNAKMDVAHTQIGIVAQIIPTVQMFQVTALHLQARVQWRPVEYFPSSWDFCKWMIVQEELNAKMDVAHTQIGIVAQIIPTVQMFQVTALHLQARVQWRPVEYFPSSRDFCK
jgi:hypothetical protein